MKWKVERVKEGGAIGMWKGELKCGNLKMLNLNLHPKTLILLSFPPSKNPIQSPSLFLFNFHIPLYVAIILRIQ